MRYFIEVESSEQVKARLLFSGGILLLIFGVLIGLICDIFDGILFVFDLVGCLFLWMGTMLWTEGKWKTTASLFAIAFVLRLALLMWDPRGVFSFLLYLPYSLTLLVGLLRVLDGFYKYLERRAVPDAREWPVRAQQMLARSEVSYWVAVLIAYLSPLMAFPAFLLYAFSLGVRLWVALMLLRRPQFLSKGLYLKEKSLRAQ